MEITVQTYSGEEYDMIVFCHLRWDFVYQRPQHLISRLAKNRKILVVEEPVQKNSMEKAPLRSGRLVQISMFFSRL